MASGRKVILTVDDSSVMRDMLKVALTDGGFDVVQAENGARALELLGEVTPDAIVTDINMPGMSGYELIAAVRAVPATRAIPVIVLTTAFALEKTTRARDAGASGWLLKPFNPEKLVDAMRRATA